MNQRELHSITGRFAPSPTGLLHFGSLITAVASYVAAKNTPCGRWLLRIDDLDQPRTVPGATEGILRQLETLGLHHDGTILYQSQRSVRYQEVLECLRTAGKIYPCSCSRKEILASAPHIGEEGPIYPGTCRMTSPPAGSPVAWRIRTSNTVITFTDLIQGLYSQNLLQEIGDFTLMRSDGIFAYQLATVIDDHDSGITQVVRGQDLIHSTPRQIFLLRQLGWNVPHYAHIPLAYAQDGHKFSKRHQHMLLIERNSAVKILSRCLEFLGMRLPDGHAYATPEELLDWACRHFSFAMIPASSQRYFDYETP